MSNKPLFEIVDLGARLGQLQARHGEPTRAWLEVQDWGKPWTQYLNADQDVLLTYARCFYYGEGG